MGFKPVAGFSWLIQKTKKNSMPSAATPATKVKRYPIFIMFIELTLQPVLS
jgi:hypothetical protein